ncbi:RNA guanine-N7 methyltransferase activating subunit-like isoform X3 [Trichoplusia ni]|uniref:RNA guanine-N7 methyltransferase activating subunit-like isoform X3 n=1 Tax=Trichoplusia ni TaxID=7111 RepID=A0A7E5WZV7_TRINI|nr:RNA guanine-N7 methyltransferase activating subunit-like isoform X3 [Trichoplusia ni]XP_026726247.1 RNA guanine-N7 methyltransferase activating subunit-like isoform X3 [Trichoplusia ni]XP_026726248.1 RNA guanine-N7 methyltransferase activating subunit-like isoform X3 [Trichoplusia ni]XP_026726249.1 RNA guanine-N7 methyltransferase activating subunit-like isoform X3 [Trichoplusia ni]XP_026726250.1 RNA guanine-N7 methyltransferase activating subunit-like isoform X3 [Trichoplusia ni]XP_0267464
MAESLTAEELEFLAKCEEELKDRFTEKDDDFMKVYNEELSKPPILDSWWIPNSGRRFDRRNNRRHHPYERPDHRDRGYDRRDDRRDHRGYNDYHEDSGQGYRQQRHRYHY